MSIDLSVSVTNANKLDKHINKNEKQDKKDKQLYNIIERKVKKKNISIKNQEVEMEHSRNVKGYLRKALVLKY